MFWPTYPWWKHWFSSSFDSYVFERDPVPLPASTVFLHLSGFQTPSSHPLLPSLCAFLFDYFSQQPKLVHTPDTLLSPQDHLFVLYHQTTRNPLATIRYHFLGQLYSSTTPHPTIYVVDAFCVHPEWRHKGLGTYLLTELHRYANQHHIPNAFFLKEGPTLPVLPLPLYSGSYVYRSLQPHVQASFTSNKKIIAFTTEQARQWISCYMKVCPNTFLVYDDHSSDAIWRVYWSPPFSILACVQDTHQQRDQQNMGWITVWLESPLMPDSIRHEASLLLSDSVSSVYSWIWMDRKWSGKDKVNQSPWKEDGGFHWYTYQWNTNRRLEQSYGIMVR